MRQPKTVPPVSDKAAEDNSFWLTLMVVVLGAFAAILNSSSINVALPKLMTIFGVAENEIEWILTAYMLVSGVAIPITGYFSDRFGIKRVYLTGLALFVVGSVLCSLSWSNETMIASRVIQGIGGGASMPVSMAIVYSIVPRKKIGVALGVWGMAAVCAPAVGPTLGGYIIDHFNWRFLFTMNIPVGVAGLVLSYFLLPEIPSRGDSKLDLHGVIFSTIGCFTLLLALSQGYSEGWTSQYIVTLFIISAFTLVMFVIVELGQDQPMLDLSLFKNSVFLISVVIGSIVTIGLFGGVFLIPIFTQNLMLLTPYQTGLLLMPAAIVTAIMMPVSGFIFDRFGAKLPTLSGLALVAWGTWKLGTINLDMSNTTIIYYMALRSLGMGLSFMPITAAGMNTVPQHLIARASALNNVIRQIAGSLGIAVLTATMQNRQAFHFARLSEAVSVDSAASSFLGLVQGYLSSAIDGTSSKAAAVYVLNGLVARESLVKAIDDTFILAAIIIIFSLPLVFFLGKAKPDVKPEAQQDIPSNSVTSTPAK